MPLLGDFPFLAEGRATRQTGSATWGKGFAHADAAADRNGAARPDGSFSGAAQAILGDAAALAIDG